MPDTSHKNAIRYPDYTCEKCGGLGWRVGFYADAGGQPKYPFVCAGCGFRTQHFAKRGAVEAARIDVQPLHPTTLPFVCEVCGAEGAENHHWAPTSLFGDEAERWPKSFLCRACHQRWHAIVTPCSN